MNGKLPMIGRQGRFRQKELLSPAFLSPFAATVKVEVHRNSLPPGMGGDPVEA